MKKTAFFLLMFALLFSMCSSPDASSINQANYYGKNINDTVRYIGYTQYNALPANVDTSFIDTILVIRTDKDSIKFCNRSLFYSYLNGEFICSHTFSVFKINTHSFYKQGGANKRSVWLLNFRFEKNDSLFSEQNVDAVINDTKEHQIFKGKRINSR